MLRCWSIAYSSAMRTGSLVVISVVAVLTTRCLVVAAMNASSVVGEEETNGGLWCSPIANTSIPASSVFCAICTIASIRSASLGTSPETGSRVMSLTEKIPNCMSCLSCAAGSRVSPARYMRLHVSQQSEGQGYSQELAEFRRSRLIVTTAAILPVVFLVWRHGQGDQRDHAPRGFLPEPARDRGRPRVTRRCNSDVVAWGVIGRDGELGYVAALQTAYA